MKSPRRLICVFGCATLAAVVALTFPALAAVTLTMETDGVEQHWFLTADLLCVEEDEGILIFDAKTQVVQWVDLEEESIQEITKSDLALVGALVGKGATGSPASADAMAQYGEMMAEARKQAAQALEGLEGQEREMAEKYLNQAFAGGPTGLAMPAGHVKRTYEPAGGKEKVNGRPCTPYTIREGEVTVGRLCAASLSELDLSQADLEILGKLRDFFAEGLDGIPLIEDALAEVTLFDPSSDEFIGFPVRGVENEDGKESVTTLISLDRESGGTTICDAGKGFRKKGSPFGKATGSRE